MLVIDGQQQGVICAGDLRFNGILQIKRKWQNLEALCIHGGNVVQYTVQGMQKYACVLASIELH